MPRSSHATISPVVPIHVPARPHSEPLLDRLCPGDITAPERARARRATLAAVPELAHLLSLCVTQVRCPDPEAALLTLYRMRRVCGETIRRAAPRPR